MIGLKEELDVSTIIVENFNSPPSGNDRTMSISVRISISGCFVVCLFSQSGLHSSHSLSYRFLIRVA